MHRSIELLAGAALEVCTAAATNKERVSSKAGALVVQHERHAPRRVSGRGARLDVPVHSIGQRNAIVACLRSGVRVGEHVLQLFQARTHIVSRGEQGFDELGRACYRGFHRSKQNPRVGGERGQCVLAGPFTPPRIYQHETQALPGGRGAASPRMLPYARNNSTSMLGNKTNTRSPTSYS